MKKLHRLGALAALALVVAACGTSSPAPSAPAAARPASSASAQPAAVTPLSPSSWFARYGLPAYDQIVDIDPDPAYSPPPTWTEADAPRVMADVQAALRMPPAPNPELNVEWRSALQAVYAACLAQSVTAWSNAMGKLSTAYDRLDPQA